MDTLTVSSSMLIPSAGNVEITPAMLGVLWGIAHELDYRRIPANYTDALWLEIPTTRLRNPEGRTDNHWLKQCFERLMGIKLEGEYNGDEWGAVVLAQWELTQGGSMARLLVPPAAISAIRAPDTFAKIEITAAYRLKGHARRLYAALADKKRQTLKPWHTYTLDELRYMLGADKKYPRWADFQRYVIAPALSDVNDYGTVKVKMTPQKSGRSIVGVRFDWTWKDIREAVDVDQENERHGSARRKQQIDNSAPPLAEPVSAKEDQRTIKDKAQYRAWSAENPKGTIHDYFRWKDENSEYETWKKSNPEGSYIDFIKENGVGKQA